MNIREAGRRELCNRRSLSAIGVPALYHNVTLTEFTFEDEGQEQAITRYIESLHDVYEEKVNLLLYGSNGSGKTTLASICAIEAYMLHYRVVFTTLSEIMTMRFFPQNMTQAQQDKAIIMTNAHFLIIDEIGKEVDTKSKSNLVLLEDVLRESISKGVVVIATTNLSLETIGKRYGASIHSLLDGTFLKVLFEGEDKRAKHFGRKALIGRLLGE